MNLIKTMSQLLKPENKPLTAERENQARTHYLAPLVNIVESHDGYELQAEMPGVAKSGLEVTVENGQLIIVGRRARYESPGVLLHGESRDYDFRRAFEIDPSIDAARISAKLDQGVLTLQLPKAEAVKPRKIVVTE
jgi:HSP20 family protein